MHCGRFSCVPGLHALEAGSTPSCDNQKRLQTLGNVPWERNCLQSRTTDAKDGFHEDHLQAVLQETQETDLPTEASRVGMRKPVRMQRGLYCGQWREKESPSSASSLSRPTT